MNASSRHSSGFTLVELSIVLVILGLLVGGVLTGQSLIRAAELRSVSTQFSQFHAAVMTFRDKYFALPGDMANATSYWTAASSCPNTASTTTATCNGNADGIIGTASVSNEVFRFWQHLANAGLIEGNYNGVTASGTWGTTKANAPAGRINSSSWFVNNWGTVVAASGLGGFDGQYDNTLEIGAVVAGSDPYNPFLKPEDAYNIDAKMDDGKPATGKVVIRAGSGLNLCTDTSATTNMAANYLLSSSTIGCALLFPRVF